MMAFTPNKRLTNDEGCNTTLLRKNRKYIERVSKRIIFNSIPHLTKLNCGIIDPNMINVLRVTLNIILNKKLRLLKIVSIKYLYTN